MSMVQINNFLISNPLFQNVSVNKISISKLFDINFLSVSLLKFYVLLEAKVVTFEIFFRRFLILCHMYLIQLMFYRIVTAVSIRETLQQF